MRSLGPLLPLYALLLVSAVTRDAAAVTPLDSVAGTWAGPTPDGQLVVEIGRRGGRIVGEIRLERSCVTLRMTARGSIRRGVLRIAAHRLGVAEMRCGDAPEPGAEPLVAVEATLPLMPLGQEWTLSTRAVGGRSLRSGRFVPTSFFWMPQRSVTLRRIAEAPGFTPEPPRLEPAVAERICPL